MDTKQNLRAKLHSLKERDNYGVLLNLTALAVIVYSLLEFCLFYYRDEIGKHIRQWFGYPF